MFIEFLLADHTLDSRLSHAGDANSEERPQHFGFLALVYMRKVNERTNILLTSEVIGVLEMPLSDIER